MSDSESVPRSGQGEAGTVDCERNVIERFAREVMVERRRARRWSIFFRLLLLLFLGVTVVAVGDWWGWTQGAARAGRHTALIEIKGVIEHDGAVSADSVISALRDALADRNTAGVVLRVNSPGGSPVQAGIIHDEIQRQRASHPKIPVYAVIEETGASASYYIAAAAERIYVDKASIVGSIGVSIDGFGFVETIDKLGIERRLLTAGRNKGFLDPFSPLNAEQRGHAQRMLDEIHVQFIEAVRRGRGDRLPADADVFTGSVWSGARAIELGLADALGSLDSVARDVIQAEEVVDFSKQEGVLDRFAKRIGAGIGGALPGALGTSISGLGLR